MKHSVEASSLAEVIDRILDKDIYNKIYFYKLMEDF